MTKKAENLQNAETEALNIPVVRTSFNNRVNMFTKDIKKYEDKYKNTGDENYLRCANNLRARRGELQYILKNWF